MKTLAEQMRIYEQYHTKEVTKITHYIGVPMVIFGLMIFFGWIHLSMPPLFDIPLERILILALLIYYFFLDWMIAIATTVIAIIMAFISELVSQPEIHALGFILFIAFFVGGWIVLLVGHFIEGRKPALADNLFQMLIAPIFLVAELFFAAGMKKDLQSEVQMSEESKDSE